MKKIIIYLVLFVACSNVFCNGGEESETKDTLPFFYRKSVISKKNLPGMYDPTNKHDVLANRNLEPMLSQYDPANVENPVEIEGLSNIPLEELKKVLIDIKKLCEVNKKGSFEVHVKVDVGGKILGIGLGGETGFAATIQCE